MYNKAICIKKISLYCNLTKEIIDINKNDKVIYCKENNSIFYYEMHNKKYYSISINQWRDHFSDIRSNRDLIISKIIKD